MDHMVAVCIVQGRGDLTDSGDHRRKRQTGANRVALPHASLWRIVHDQHWCALALLEGEVKDPHNRGMHQACQGLRLGEELLDMGVVQEGVQHLEGSLALEIAMLPQVHLRLAAASEEPYEGVVAKVLSHAISHDQGSWEQPFPHEY